MEVNVFNFDDFDDHPEDIQVLINEAARAAMEAVLIELKSKYTQDATIPWPELMMSTVHIKRSLKCKNPSWPNYRTGYMYHSLRIDDEGNGFDIEHKKGDFVIECLAALKRDPTEITEHDKDVFDLVFSDTLEGSISEYNMEYDDENF